MRINKYIADSGHCSRRQADELILQGRVFINQKRAILGDFVQDGDQVFIGKKNIIKKKNKDFVTIAYHKPVGIICTTDDSKKDTIIQAIGYPERIVPIGLLDVASSGLILLTNNGELVNKINKAENKIDKEYSVHVDKLLTLEVCAKLRSGVLLDGRLTSPCRIKRMGDRSFNIILQEGWNRQIRSICEVLGYKVVRLVRIRIGRLHLGNLPVGTWIKINPRDLF